MSEPHAQPAAGVGGNPAISDREDGGARTQARAVLYRKVTWRLMPFLMLCFIVNYIDRVNVGIAQIRLKADLGLSDQVYGIGVGLFFLGFILFEVPSNILMERFGARRTLARIMIAWGVVSAGTMFIRGPGEFYAARLLLGVAEAGFFPGILLYLTYWFPSAYRTRAMSIFYLGLPLAGIIGLPLSGWIMHSLEGVGGLRSWQWLFLLEGLPAVLLGFASLRLLQDGPASARWLSEAERAMIARDLAVSEPKAAHTGNDLVRALRDPRVYVLGIVGCGTYTLANTVSFWSPIMISEAGVSNIAHVGLLGALAPLVAVAAMLAVSWNSDRTLERRWHAACSEFVAAAALVALSFSIGQLYPTLALIAVMTAGHYCGLTTFWSVPSIYLPPRVRAAGIAVVTVIGSMAAALSPMMLGYLKMHTGSLALGLRISAVIVACGGIVLLTGIPRRALSESANRPRSE